MDYSGAARREFDQKEEISHLVLGKEEKTEGKARQKTRLRKAKGKGRQGKAKQGKERNKTVDEYFGFIGMYINIHIKASDHNSSSILSTHLNSHANHHP